MTNKVNKELLQKYFAGNASIYEKNLIDEWAKEPKNQETFYFLLSQKESQQPQFMADTEAAVARHFERFQQKEQEIVVLEVDEKFNKKPFYKLAWKKWALTASVFLIVGLGIWLNQNAIFYKTHQTEFGEIKSFELPDGSNIVLNSNSKLRIPRFGFGSKVREVFLEGEGQFSIKHTIDHLPFVVKTNQGLEVVVLGTEFTVFSRSRGVKVVLNKGKVRLQYPNGKKSKQLLMTPGESIAFDKTNQLKEITQTVPQSEPAWKEHRFVFEETTLGEISQIFDENFGVKVKFASPDLEKWTVSGSFTARNADELLEVLSEASNLNIKHENDYFLIANP
jgi:transmembrane sensor